VRKPPGRGEAQTAILTAWLFLLHTAAPGASAAYTLNSIVADMRQSASQSGNTACPQRTRFDLSSPAGISRQWSTSLGTSPATVLTADQTSAGQLDEIENVIAQSFGSWTGVTASDLAPTSLATLRRTPTQNACAADGINTMCLNQSDPAFTAGVLAFTRITTADTIGEQISASSPPSTFVGQILDADILVRPADPTVTFATPAALPGNPSAYDLESILTHEMGHLFGFGHSAVWTAVMFPFVPPPGTFFGSRPTAQSPDAPLADDDRAAVRALYPDVSDTAHVGSIGGHVLPANVLALAGEPSGTTGISAAQVVAVDAATGAVAAAALSGWSCSDPGPPVFDGSYVIEHLAVGPSQAYQVYAEPLDGPVSPSDALEQSTICRNVLSDPGWPAQFACTAPTPITKFSVGVRAGP
jgi:hypothetical protein